MMQTMTMPTGLSGLLSQILGGLDENGVRLLQSVDGAGALAAADGGEFVQSLAGQLKSLIVERGADPVEVASIQDETLVAEFFALVQGQSESPAGGASITAVLGGLMAGAEAPAMADEDEESSARVEAAPKDPAEHQADALICLAALPNVVLERLSEAGRILPTNADTAEQRVSQPIPTLEAAISSDSTAADLETLTRALLRQVTPSAVQPGESPEQSNTSPAAGPTAVLPAWLARQLNSDDHQVWINAAMSASMTASAPADPAAGTLREALLVSSTSNDGRPESGLELESLLQSTESADPAPTGTTRTPTATTETATIGARPQTLDLNRLLQPGGEQRLAEQVRWSVEQGLETAEIKLHPPSLGALDVRVVQEGDRTHVQFVSAHPVAREVLEAAMPRLREALAQDGVLLGNVSVSDQAPNDRGESGRERGGTAGAEELDSVEDADPSELGGTLSMLSRRLDVFT